MNLDFAILAGLLAAIYGYMKVAMETVYVINGKRDLVLDIDEDGTRLDRSRKCHLIYTDVVPLIIGLSLFIGVFTLAFLVMGIVIVAGFYPDVKQYVAFVFFAATGASLYALWIVVTENLASLKIMKEHVRGMPTTANGLRSIRCCRGSCRLSPAAEAGRPDAAEPGAAPDPAAHGGSGSS
jgi:hypothetical protein